MALYIRRGNCTSVEQLEEGVILWKVKKYNSVQKRKNMALWNMERNKSAEQTRYGSVEYAEQIKVLVLWNVERFTSVNRKGFGSVEL